MKKILFPLCLAALMLLSGCIGFFNPVPNSQLSKSLISKVQNNIDTHSFEGFTHQSTFADVLGKIETRKVSGAHLAYRSNLLGYPTVNEYVFSPYRGNKLLLDFMAFDMLPGSGGNETEDLLSKLDAELGSHKESSYEDDEKDYVWHKDGLSIDMSVDENDNQPDVTITVSPSVVILGILPSETPSIFPYKIGTDFNTVYRSETPSELPEESQDNSYLDYTDNGIEIRLQFKADETGIWLSEGRYDIYANDMGVNGGLDYFDSLADGLKNAIGAPLSQGYGIPIVDEDGSSVSYEIGTGGQGLSSKDILNSGKKYYWLDISWPGIQFDANYDTGITIRMEFSEEYFSGTVKSD